MARLSLTAAALGALCLLSPAAFATANFPQVIKTHLAAPSAPSCAVCHRNGLTGAGTVTTPFGAALRAQGLEPGDEPSLKAALDALATAALDSDGDGATDIAELKAETDPNAAPGAEVDPDAPRYGCIGSAAPGALALPLALLSLTARLRRRLSERRGRP